MKSFEFVAAQIEAFQLFDLANCFEYQTWIHEG